MIQIGQTEFYLLMAMIVFIAIPIFIIIGFFIFKRLPSSSDKNRK